MIPHLNRIIFSFGLVSLLIGFTVQGIDADHSEMRQDISNASNTTENPTTEVNPTVNRAIKAVNSTNEAALWRMYEKFMKKLLQRKPRQDDGDDGEDDGEEGAAGAAGAAGLNGNGAFQALTAVNAVVPQLLNTLTQLSASVNQGLNGTDTPNIPSLFIRQSMDAFTFFQAVAGAVQMSQAENKTPPPLPIVRVPGRNPNPTSNRRPNHPSLPPNYQMILEQFSPEDRKKLEMLIEAGPSTPAPEDYLVEEIEEETTPTPKTTTTTTPPPEEFNDYDFTTPQPNSNKKKPFLQNSIIFSQQPVIQPLPIPERQPTTLPLRQIYNKFRSNPESFTLTPEVIEAPPDAISNELLSSVQLAIANILSLNQDHSQPQGPSQLRPFHEAIKQAQHVNRPQFVAPPPQKLSPFLNQPPQKISSFSKPPPSKTSYPNPPQQNIYSYSNPPTLSFNKPLKALVSSSSNRIVTTGKPIYWMNMYYPSGYPVLVKVRATTVQSTSPRMRRRKTKPTTTAPPTTTELIEYYEDS